MSAAARSHLSPRLQHNLFAQVEKNRMIIEGFALAKVEREKAQVQRNIALKASRKAREAFDPGTGLLVFDNATDRWAEARVMTHISGNKHEIEYNHGNMKTLSEYYDQDAAHTGDHTYHKLLPADKPTAEKPREKTEPNHFVWFINVNEAGTELDVISGVFKSPSTYPCTDCKGTGKIQHGSLHVFKEHGRVPMVHNCKHCLGKGEHQYLDTIEQTHPTVGRQFQYTRLR